MTDEQAPEKPSEKAALSLNAVAEEFAVMADFFRQRLLMRANQVDQLSSSNAELTARLLERPEPDQPA